MTAEEPTPHELAEHALDIAEQIERYARSDMEHAVQIDKTKTDSRRFDSIPGRLYIAQAQAEAAADAVEYALELLEGGRP